MTSTPMTLAEFIPVFETVVLQPAGTVRGEDLLDSISRWDSMAVIEFMSMADEKLGIQLEPSQIAACVRVADLAALCGVSTAVSDGVAPVRSV